MQRSREVSPSREVSSEWNAFQQYASRPIDTDSFLSSGEPPLDFVEGAMSQLSFREASFHGVPAGETSYGEQEGETSEQGEEMVNYSRGRWLYPSIWAEKTYQENQARGVEIDEQVAKEHREAINSVGQRYMDYINSSRVTEEELEACSKEYHARYSQYLKEVERRREPVDKDEDYRQEIEQNFYRIKYLKKCNISDVQCDPQYAVQKIAGYFSLEEESKERLKDIGVKVEEEEGYCYTVISFDLEKSSWESLARKLSRIADILPVAEDSDSEDKLSVGRLSEGEF